MQVDSVPKEVCVSRQYHVLQSHSYRLTAVHALLNSSGAVLFIYTIMLKLTILSYHYESIIIHYYT